MTISARKGRAEPSIAPTLKRPFPDEIHQHQIHHQVVNSGDEAKGRDDWIRKTNSRIHCCFLGCVKRLNREKPWKTENGSNKMNSQGHSQTFCPGVFPRKTINLMINLQTQIQTRFTQQTSISGGDYFEASRDLSTEELVRKVLQAARDLGSQPKLFGLANSIQLPAARPAQASSGT